MSLLEFKDVSRANKERSVIRGVNLTMVEGEKLVLFGRSGAGKRTFLRLAAGIASPSSGSVTLNDPVPGRPMPVGFVTHEGGLINNLSLLENVVLPLVYHGVLGLREAHDRGAALLQDWGISDEAGLRPAASTPAARRLAQLARALLAEPALFLLEDPLEDMDSATAVLIRRALERACTAGRAGVIVATEKPGSYLDWGDRFLLIWGGRVRIFEGRKALLEDGGPEVEIFLR